ncbi:MAG: 5'-nucleotidase C-terminal domain-containing protein [Chitinophagales bacterium]
MQYESYRIVDSLDRDSTALLLINNYKSELDSEMEEKLVYNKTDMYKRLPESELGNFMADVCLERTKKELGINIDLAILNYGGIRLRSISKGWIKKAQIFELMPFDNFIVAQNIRGDTLKMLLDQIAAYGGWPISGAAFQIKNAQADSIFINGLPIDAEHHYTISTSDYLANGGDKMHLLAEIKQIQTGILLRDALIDYCENVNASGDSLYFETKGRITKR